MPPSVAELGSVRLCVAFKMDLSCYQPPINQVLTTGAIYHFKSWLTQNGMPSGQKLSDFMFTRANLYPLSWSTWKTSTLW